MTNKVKGGFIYNGIAYHFDGSEPTPLILNKDGTMTPVKDTCKFCKDKPCGNSHCPYTEKK